MKTARKPMQHPVSVLALVGLTLWTAAALGCAWAVLVKWYGSVLMGGFALPVAG